mmetsp:Transcript_14222/g.21873  ORF Transcript_14222/g.21873 Transcript_14222/m.21873 type:complete len:105 (-) Transcript_14222:2962-3276(-)
MYIPTCTSVVCSMHAAIGWSGTDCPVLHYCIGFDRFSAIQIRRASKAAMCGGVISILHNHDIGRALPMNGISKNNGPILTSISLSFVEYFWSGCFNSVWLMRIL